MRACLSFFRMRLVNGLQYRTAALAGMATQFFWGVMEILLYRAFYDAHAEAFPMEFSHLVSYIWLRQAFLALLNTWAVEHELFDAILSGNVAYELCRPVGLYGMWFARTLALRMSRAALRCVPILAVALLPGDWRLQVIGSAGTMAAFLASLMLATLVTAAFTLIIVFSCFYTTSSTGVLAIAVPISDLMSGGLIPFPFMPDGLARVLQLSPFGAMQNAPLRIYSGDIGGAMVPATLALQVFWLLALGGIGYLMQRHGMRRLCVQGG